ncbi:MAG: hypothetical protein A3C93_02795 [Candidatus Lloydbacteria bacterium RIFCSPHIGHO2_02_FULL_54_17]|uniref:Uncharacterized protein n=1 Tax=Candidatus Lloydbacteria bacterium RIFCSPHIGHO2_02_FULL_54_17 TaxID=1798664 RepID=A0A1G2DBD5_9BACT|nr:MAG: hypothetical protein A2762_06050 [Candidatus Lloydbacteria bacterium RIFCSPHIGHO2_01_FULL_54_11]OGZ10947.1 MAG: hypothetical protein A3C93_02795 [Candidatus Lloydbacteria bacterium RIFCSPHIGHO2_02_FULL_54_17]OGZ14927.1 MAG: hypothetical protein A2948_05390 [Candidatus Lloydbacteria bacterium RIFCSPLOWO2_01_FULL_54_18]OGZ17160.1 MAG: hypothetical protein A3H76_04070 [Candidatus Lloydbacteria bacterium RIFCSPLOWO2_02_FULL_54_12]
MDINTNMFKSLLSEEKRKMLFDVLVVLVLPGLFVVGYFFWSGDDDPALLSLMVPPEENREFGAKTKEALAKLGSIKMDAALFQDPAFLSLQEFKVDIDFDVPLGRSYPFTPPDALR